MAHSPSLYVLNSLFILILITSVAAAGQPRVSWASTKIAKILFVKAARPEVCLHKYVHNFSYFIKCPANPWLASLSNLLITLISNLHY